MLRATVVRIDDSILIEDAAIQTQGSRRGSGEGHIWRGTFSLQGVTPRPTMGETLHLRLDDNSLIAAVITEIDGSRVHFRARGRAPVQSDTSETEVLQ